VHVASLASLKSVCLSCFGQNSPVLAAIEVCAEGTPLTEQPEAELQRGAAQLPHAKAAKGGRQKAQSGDAESQRG
jgi:hypothetical protein